jgi:hypothetical protein
MAVLLSAPSAMAAAVASLTAPWAASSIGSDAEKLDLGFVRVGDEAALEPAGTAGDRRQALPDPATGAGFGGHQALAIGQKQAADFGGKRFERRFDRTELIRARSAEWPITSRV